MTPDLRVLSFGYGHDTPPKADTVEDVRHWFRDPDINPSLRAMTGRDQEVVDKVLGTVGVREYIAALYELTAVRIRLRVRTVTVAVGCVGGRHRSVVIADTLARRAEAVGWSVEVEHLHVDRPVIRRDTGRGAR